MIDITHKNTTLRYAHAQAILKVSKPETIDAIKQNKVPKGNVLEIARAAGLLAVKKTAELIPDCHPLPIEYTHISYQLGATQINIDLEVKTTYKTGVEVEAMHGASLVALTLYDMLKPIDKGIEICNIRLKEKRGGKSDFKDGFKTNPTAHVIVCSDSVSVGKKKDKAGKTVVQKLQENGVRTTNYKIIPDEVEQIQSVFKKSTNEEVDLLIFVGGTGLSPRDVTPEAIRPFLEREIPGIMEAARSYGQNRTPYAILSRGLAGVTNNTLVLTLPGSTNGASQSVDALFPSLLHILRIFKGARHD
ncbi:MAG: bifunctional molybdenum cofactor biosynthesis protein MoaC/MoaB [Flavobacteriales bacterium]|nr:bifunctional molybdenum cofactor biosynthesis protein MoaC/MoaB [Flavobacteriales bacterium]